MTPFFVVAALIALPGVSAARVKLVVVPSSAADCARLEPIATRLELSGFRVVRVEQGTAASAEALRLREGADAAVLGNGDRAGALEWPDLTPPGTATTAIALACNGDLRGALETSGALVDPVILEIGSGEDSTPRAPLLARMAKARARRRLGQDARAPLAEVLEATERGESAPSWRARVASVDSVEVFGATVVAFAAKELHRFDLQTGAFRSKVTIGPALPGITVVPGGRGVVAAKGLVGVDEEPTPRLAFQVPLDSAWPELVSSATVTFAAGGSEVVAIDPRSGDVLWRRERFKPIGSGPVWLNGKLAIPLETKIQLLDPSDGHLTGEIELPDEIASPLLRFEGDVYVNVGGDKLARVSASGPEVQVLARGLFGATWPPAVFPNWAWLGVKERRRGYGIARVDVGPGPRENVPIPKPELGRPPLLEIPMVGLAHVGPSGDTAVLRNALGKEVWRTSVGGAVQELSATSHALWVRSEHRLISIDLANGKRIGELRFEAPIVAMSLKDIGGAVALANGEVYGVARPDDPRPRRWLRDLRLELAEAYAAKGDRAKARAAYAAVLSREPEDADALMGMAKLASQREATLLYTRILAQVSERDPYAVIAREKLSE